MCAQRSSKQVIAICEADESVDADGIKVQKWKWIRDRVNAAVAARGRPLAAVLRTSQGGWQLLVQVGKFPA